MPGVRFMHPNLLARFTDTQEYQALPQERFKVLERAPRGRPADSRGKKADQAGQRRWRHLPKTADRQCRDNHVRRRRRRRHLDRLYLNQGHGLHEREACRPAGNRQVGHDTRASLEGRSYRGAASLQRIPIPCQFLGENGLCQTACGRQQDTCSMTSIHSKTLKSLDFVKWVNGQRMICITKNGTKRGSAFAGWIGSRHRRQTTFQSGRQPLWRIMEWRIQKRENKRTIISFRGQ